MNSIKSIQIRPGKFARCSTNSRKRSRSGQQTRLGPEFRKRHALAAANPDSAHGPDKNPLTRAVKTPKCTPAIPPSGRSIARILNSSAIPVERTAAAIYTAPAKSKIPNPPETSVTNCNIDTAKRWPSARPATKRTSAPPVANPIDTPIQFISKIDSAYRP